MMKFNNKDINKMYIGDTLVNRVNDGDFQYMPKHDYASDYLTFDIVSGGTIAFSLQRNNTAYTKTISASTDNGQTWTEMQSGYRQSASTINVSAGDKVIFKGTNAAYGNGQNYCSTFSGSTAYFNACGNIMSLIYGDDFRGQTTLTETYTFRNLFMNTNVISAGNLILPATTLADSCYGAMFYNCRSLTSPPELPATTLVDYCYNGMFSGCRSLTVAPELPVTTLTVGCYSGMFANCNSLTTAPELPATTMTERCYSGMFEGCTSLTTAPELSATIMNNGCYNSMFSHCTSLTTAPELPATTLANNCYKYMFLLCTSLNYVKCLATDISADECTTQWMQDVSSTGTFVKASSMNDWTTGVDGIPEGWIIENV